MCCHTMPASYWGLLAKVGPYKLTKTDQKHLHERGNNKHYTSAFTRMRPSSLGSEVLPPGQQDNSNLLPKIFKGMVPDPNFRGVVTGRNPANYPQTTSDRDRAIFNTSEEMEGLYKRNVNNLNTEQKPESFTGTVQRPRVSPLKIDTFVDSRTSTGSYYTPRSTGTDSTSSSLFGSYRTPSSVSSYPPSSSRSSGSSYKPSSTRSSINYSNIPLPPSPPASPRFGLAPVHQGPQFGLAQVHQTPPGKPPKTYVKYF